MKRQLLLASLALITVACASDRVIVDTKGVDMSRYNQDQAECQSYASQVSTGGSVAKGAGFGAAIGAALGAIFGNTTTVVRGAGAGGVVGGAKGAVRSEDEKNRVLRNCLSGRGYKVLN
ncbi:MAG: glycine zipper family protein [Panacagrimonas sp.]